MNEFPICGREKLKEEMALKAMGYVLAFNALCKNEDSMEPHHATCTGPIWAEKKEEHKPMDKIIVTCRGFTGELTYLERKELPPCPPCFAGGKFAGGKIYVYDLSIEDSKEKVTHSFSDVKLSEFKFLGGEVIFGG